MDGQHQLMKKQPDPRQSLERTASHILRELPKLDPEHRRSKICRLGRNFSEDATAVQRSFLELEAPKVLLGFLYSQEPTSISAFKQWRLLAAEVQGLTFDAQRASCSMSYNWMQRPGFQCGGCGWGVLCVEWS